MLIRLFCIESYRISTDSMEEALHKGDYILVNKIPGKNKPVRGKVVLFTSPLSRDSADAPLFISRCIGMPGDTIRVSMDGYTINGQKIPRSPRSLSSYFITLSAKETFLETLEKLDIPLRDFRQESFGCMLSLTAFEEYQLREELPDAINRHFIGEQMQEYMLIVPRKDRAYPLDAASLTACKEIILRETDGKASFRDGKLYLDGRETNFFFFRQDYYWVLSDNTNEAVAISVSYRPTISSATLGSAGTAPTNNESLNPFINHATCIYSDRLSRPHTTILQDAPIPGSPYRDRRELREANLS